MSWANLVVTGLTGGLVASLLTLWGVLLTARWRITEENIIKERAKWRDAVRLLIEQSMIKNDRTELRRIAAGLALRMNPKTHDDRELVALVYSLQHRANRKDETYQKIVALSAHILKHDWTRAKWEARPRLWWKAPHQTRHEGPNAYVVTSLDQD